MNDSIEDLTPHEAHARLQSSTARVYLDVRSVDEFTEGHPEGAWNLPLLHRTPSGMEPNHDFAKVAEAVLPREGLILVGCQAGGRSRRACAVLLQMGFEVANVAGGWGGAVDPRTRTLLQEGWRDAGLPSETGSGADASWTALAGRAEES